MAFTEFGNNWESVQVSGFAFVHLKFEVSERHPSGYEFGDISRCWQNQERLEKGIQTICMFFSAVV